MTHKTTLLCMLLSALTTQNIIADTFEPQGQHCSDYSYINMNPNMNDYVATGMKANSDITINEVSIGGIATFDYDGNGIDEALWKIELVTGDTRPNGEILATLREIQDQTGEENFTFSTNVTVEKGTNVWVKYTPIAPQYGTYTYSYMAKECWCDSGNCNENDTLQLGTHLDGQGSDRVSLVSMGGSNPSDVLTNTHFQNLKITYSLYNEVNNTITTPNSLAVTKVNKNHVLLTWNQQDSVTAYEIEIYVKKRKKWKKILSQNLDKNELVVKAKKRKTYKFRVRAISNQHTTPWSEFKTYKRL